MAESQAWRKNKARRDKGLCIRGNESKEAVQTRTLRALEAAQKYSLVANSVKSEIVMEPDISVV
jgi:hypothetical protein